MKSNKSTEASPQTANKGHGEIFRRRYLRYFLKGIPKELLHSYNLDVQCVEGIKVWVKKGSPLLKNTLKTQFTSVNSRVRDQHCVISRKIKFTSAVVNLANVFAFFFS